MMQSVNFLGIVKNRNKFTLIPPLDPGMRKFPPNTSLICITYAFKQGGGNVCTSFTFKA